MKNITINTLVLLTTLASPFVLAQGGSLGGNPSVETGAVNVSLGKCTQYKLDVKAALNAGKQVSSITVPKGCEAIKEK
ncbi:hypothetical protein AB6D20_004670 [Vibrio splendidus]|uniref:DUF1496 domain-containing protein n=1 Tax=Vibrio splendidus TaxID=29497 RepID=A0A2T5ETT9_VIBSP|nr:hypothetical protein [Vibrio splendidus]OEF76059.1 hypothetical protein A148_16100 [Vibrio splendidus 1F-157]PMI39201.1 hypothetical protein BCU63_28160 [Vibrio splendidus]PMJ69519.1 hypothetical protein BCU23_17715 [Vibrio splendidus]PTP32440.1 hypothetical protein CWO07_14770 [Vibrio splendidus]PTP71743.1 hypothetical protein CWO23_08620 [Vibrio splendidus]